MRHYARNIGDLAAATRGLDLLHRGAYDALLDAYYLAERPLPLEAAERYRLADARSAAERRAVDAMLARFFTRQADGYHQKRCDAEIERQHIKSEQARSAVNVRHNHDREARRANEQRRDDERITDVVRTYSENCDSRIPPTIHEPLPPTVPSEPPGGKSVARKRAHTPAKPAAKTPLPANFAISDRVRAWASDKGHTRLDERLEHFVGKARMNGYRYADWDEALMTAIRDDWAKLDGKPNGAAGRLTAAGQQTAAALGRWIDDEVRNGTSGP